MYFYFIIDKEKLNLSIAKSALNFMIKTTKELQVKYFNDRKMWKKIYRKNMFLM
jgi:hypothetical protein